MLQNWLNLNISNHPYQSPKGYSLVVVEEHDPNDLLLATRAIRDWIRYCYSSSGYVQQRIAAGAYVTAEDLYQQEKFPNQWTNMAADFGEAIGHFLLESHSSLGFWLPVLRLREKPDPEGSPRGFDLLGFLLEEQSGVNMLCIGEVRLRTTTTNTKQTIVRGHSTLSNYKRSREIQAIGRTAHWLYQHSGLEDADKLARFGDAWAAQPFERRHVFIGVFDKNILIDDMIIAMSEVPNILSTFVACVTIVGYLRDRIKEAYAA